ETRNFATYNPQVARDDVFMLGRRGTAKGGRIAPVRSTSALVLSSTNANREKIYVQQPPIAASGYSSQAMNPHYPHTERTTETRTCSDCHLARSGDNNAILAQTLMLGTKFMDFVGLHAWVGGDGEVAAVQVTEWDEPQAVIGSYLQRYAYPDWFAAHQARGGALQRAERHRSGRVGCLQLRGEYLYAAAGSDGLRVFDVAAIGNKGVSQKILTAPFGPFGQRTHVPSRNATCLSLVTTQPVHPARNQGELMREQNQEQPFHPIYNYAVVSDAEEGLILVDINTLADGEPRNNRLRRALTWNPDGVLNGARHIEMGGYRAYVSTPRGLVIVNLDQPLAPQVDALLELPDLRASALQFRYLFVTDGEGLKVVDVTDPRRPALVAGSAVALDDAERVFVARTYAYVAAGRQGLAIVDIEHPENIRLQQLFDAGGAIKDLRDVVVASTNASLFAYLADGEGGLKVVQLTSPASQPNFYGFSPEPKPELIAHYATRRPALSLSRALERDRGVDETGGQMAVFGRLGSRPLNLPEMRRLYLNDKGEPWYVDDHEPK
ncbi:MAG: LVIVD repeat-containing protein, partial [Lysobacterales bacterium]